MHSYVPCENRRKTNKQYLASYGEDGEGMGGGEQEDARIRNIFSKLVPKYF